MRVLTPLIEAAAALFAVAALPRREPSLFRLAASGCARDANEWFAANAELKALGETP